ncbi:hypothetical protein OESDEN_15476, partial [Oesophagostomum dentatum]
MSSVRIWRDSARSGPMILKAYASPSYESDETGSNIDENMMIKGPEWVVPQEYSSSPIVKELAESCDQNFIVRASSKPGCMAISVRLPDDHEMHTDHYIIEYGKRGSV